MGVQRIVCNISTSQLRESRVFYTELFGLSEAMDLGWIVTLVTPGNPSVQLSLLEQDETAPIKAAISIGVDDVDRVYADAVRRGVPIVYPLTDEPWGVRRFFLQDPNGVVVNVVSHRTSE